MARSQECTERVHWRVLLGDRSASGTLGLTSREVQPSLDVLILRASRFSQDPSKNVAGWRIVVGVVPNTFAVVPGRTDLHVGSFGSWGYW